MVSGEKKGRKEESRIQNSEERTEKMKKALVLTIVAGMLLAGAANVEGSVYYVSQSSAGGGSGSSYDNRMSVADHDGSTFSPGDVIYLVDTITSRIEIPSSGDPGNEITYRGDYTGHPGVLDVYTSYGSISGDYKQNITIDGLEIRNGRLGISFINGNHNITIKRCEIHQMTGEGAKGILIGSNTSPVSRNSNIVIGGAPGDGNEVFNCGQNTGGGDIITAHCNDVLISYNRCYGGNTDTGIDGYADMGSIGGIIEYNEFSNHVKSDYYPTGEYGEDGVDLKGSSDYVVRYNHIYGNRVNGIGFNEIYQGYGKTCTNIRIYNNFVHGSGNTNINTMDLLHTAYIYNNLISNSKTGHGMVCTNGGEDVWIYNNTFVNNYCEPVTGGLHKYQLLIGSGENRYVKNNIFYSDTHAKLIYKRYTDDSSVHFDNNRYCYTGGAVLFNWDGVNKTLAQVQALGQEANGSEGNPGFDDIANADYTLAFDSACINTGADLGTDYAWGLDPINTDFTTYPPSVYTLDQNNYGVGWEIGAYVFTGVACLPIDQSGWGLVYVDSEELVEDGGYPAEKSFDGNPDTFWSTKWSLPDPEFYHPHEIQVDLDGFYDICGFRYLPRQDVGPGDENGMINEYEFYVSGDSDDWGAAVATGAFAKDKTEKQVSFDHTLGQYIRLVALSEVNGNPWTTMAELNVLAVQQDADINNDGKINIEDFAVLSVWWDDNGGCVEPGWCGGADFNMSGTVDMFDLTYFAENWLRQAG